VIYKQTQPPTFNNEPDMRNVDENYNIQHLHQESINTTSTNSFMILFDKYSKLDSQFTQMKKDMVCMQKRMGKYETHLQKSPKSISSTKNSKIFGLKSKHNNIILYRENRVSE
jgi:hypothetical protein